MGVYYNAPSGSQIDQFAQFGHPGNLYSSIEFTGGQIDFTGSNYGYGAILFASSSNEPLGNVTLSGGGTIPLRHLKPVGQGFDTAIASHLIPLSLKQISGSEQGFSIYCFKTQKAGY